MRCVEQDDCPRQDLEHTRESYADTADYVRALEKSGALQTTDREYEPPVMHWRKQLTPADREA